MSIKNWLSVTAPLTRTQYALIGFALFAIKYNIDRLIAFLGYGRLWFITDYVSVFSNTGRFKSTLADWEMLSALAYSAIPFIIIGTLATLRRLRDANLPGWFVCFFFLPFLNLLFFGMLCLIPGKAPSGSEVESHKTRWLDRLIPRTADGSALFGAGISAGLALFGTWFSMYVLKDYGITLFLGIPFIQGLASVLIFNYHSPRSLKASVGVASLSVLFLAILIFSLAMEGAVCILMAAPIAFLLAIAGALIGDIIQRANRKAVPAALILFVAVPFLSNAEHELKPETAVTPITTSVVIDRSRQDVWNQLVTFNNIGEPKDLFFKAGIAYPVKAVIEGKGAGAIRRCQFTTGDFVEPITVWDEPNLLSFSVKEMPPPLVEMSIYDSLKLPHLENYFVSEKGQFKLTTLPSGKTLLEGTTWYRHDIWPRVYWKLWSDYILHKIHYRVLNHIKAKAENK